MGEGQQGRVVLVWVLTEVEWEVSMALAQIPAGPSMRVDTGEMARVAWAAGVTKVVGRTLVALLPPGVLRLAAAATASRRLLTPSMPPAVRPPPCNQSHNRLPSEWLPCLTRG